MKLTEFFQEDISVEHGDAHQAFVAMTGAGFTSRLFGSALPVYRSSLVCYDGQGEVDWITLRTEHKKIGRFIVSNYLEDKEYSLKLYRVWLGRFKKMLEFYYQEFVRDLFALADDDLKKWIDGFVKFYLDVSMPGFLDGFMFYADQRLDKLLKEFCAENKIADSARIFSILGAPAEASFFGEEEVEIEKMLGRLARRGYRGGALKKFISKNALAEKEAAAHLLKYSWIKSSYAGYVEYRLDDFVKKAEEIFRAKKTGAKIFKKNKILKERIIRKYKFTPEIMAICRLSELYIKWQDQRKMYTLTFVALLEKYLREVSRRKNIPFSLLCNADRREFARLLDPGKKLLGRLKARLKPCIYIYSGGETKEIITGARVKKIMKRLNREVDRDVREFFGMAASLGKARGKVKVIMSAKNINQVKEGDILVAPMTRPEHLPGMKKAAAIITDDGGITCHAAIVARELGLPCIIGTKIATKVLHDGDLVEVDADKGIVKILK